MTSWQKCTRTVKNSDLKFRYSFAKHAKQEEPFIHWLRTKELYCNNRKIVILILPMQVTHIVERSVDAMTPYQVGRWYILTIGIRTSQVLTKQHCLKVYCNLRVSKDIGSVKSIRASCSNSSGCAQRFEYPYPSLVSIVKTRVKPAIRVPKFYALQTTGCFDTFLRVIKAYNTRLVFQNVLNKPTKFTQIAFPQSSDLTVGHGHNAL